MKANEKQQTVYDFLMLNIRSSIYSDVGFKAMLEKLKGVGEPVKAVAHTAAMLVKSISKGMEAEGGPVPKEVVGPAIAETVGEVALIAAKNGIIEQSAAKDVAKQALPMAVKFYAEQPKPGTKPELPPPAKSPGLINQNVGAPA